MNLTLNSLAYDLHLTIRNGHIVDDDDLDIRQIKFWIKNNRAVWIKNELNKGNSIPQRFIQDLGNVDLVKSDIGMYAPVGCSILKTAIEIPNTIEHKGLPTLTRVGPTLTTHGTFTIIPFERVPYVGNGRFNSNGIYAFWFNNYVYLVSKSSSLNFTGMRKVNIRGVFADPEAVTTYEATKDYPISEALWVYMKDIILKSDVAMFLSTIGDVVNDATDTTQPQEGQQKELLSGGS